MYIVYNSNTGGIIDKVDDYDIAVDTMSKANQFLGLYCNTRRWYKDIESEVSIHRDAIIQAPIVIRTKE